MCAKMVSVPVRMATWKGLWEGEYQIRAHARLSCVTPHVVLPLKVECDFARPRTGIIFDTEFRQRLGDCIIMAESHLGSDAVNSSLRWLAVW